MIFKDLRQFDRATKVDPLFKRETDLEKLSSYLENKNEMNAWAQKDPMNISLDTYILMPFFSEIILVSVQLAVKLR